MAEHDAALAALQMAIQTEIDGYSFYKKFAAQTEDPDARVKIVSRTAGGKYTPGLTGPVKPI